MDKLVKLPSYNETAVCVGDLCGAAAINQTGLTVEQDNITGVKTA